MSMIFCIACNKDIDTDFDAEHFNEDEECVKWLWDNQEITINKSEYDELKASHERLKKVLLFVKTDVDWFASSPTLKRINKALKQAK